MDAATSALRTAKWVPTKSRGNAAGYEDGRPKKVDSMVFGKTRRYGFPLTDSKLNAKQPEVYAALQALIAELAPDFKYNAITVNRNFKCLPHKDWNKGISAIIGLGDYTGGELNLDGDKKQIRHELTFFDGHKTKHWVEDWEGERFTVVYYWKENFSKLTPEEAKALCKRTTDKAKATRQANRAAKRRRVSSTDAEPPTSTATTLDGDGSVVGGGQLENAQR